MKKFDKKIQIKIFKIILIIIWMIIVFGFSAQKGADSGNTSKSFTIEIMQMIFGKSIIENSLLIENIETVIRKLAHYTIYVIGGFLIMNYAYTTEKTDKQKISYSITLGVCYAISDELHQFFVPDRSAKLFDVGIDTLGINTGVIIYFVLRKCLEKALRGK